MIIEDTRQQAGKHDNIERWMRAHGVEFSPRARALEFGDYVSEDADGNPLSNVAVDTKKDVQELAMDVGRDHARFVRECERARAAGYRLVVLVEEHADYETDRGRLHRWLGIACRRCRRCRPLAGDKCVRYKRRPMTGRQVAAICERMTERHGVTFAFCSRRDTGRRICELLGVRYDDERP